MSSRPQAIALDFPELDLTLTADLHWDRNPELCELLVRNLPFRTAYSHTMSSGAGMYAPTRIVENVPVRWAPLMPDAPRGTVTLNAQNYKTLCLYYGPLTEPLPCRPVAQVRPEDMRDLDRVGAAVWHANYSGTQPVLVDVRIA